MWIFMHILAFETRILALRNSFYIHTNHLNHSMDFIIPDRFLIKLLIENRSAKVDASGRV